MRHQHSFNRLFYHLVFITKNKEPFISSEKDEQFLLSLLKKKAHDLNAYIEEFGSWYDHVHILIRTSPSIELSKIYRQLKGYSSWAWNKKFPDRFFKWADGAFAATCDPDNTYNLRLYIRGQRDHHHNEKIEQKWEPED